MVILVLLGKKPVRPVRSVLSALRETREHVLISGIGQLALLYGNDGRVQLRHSTAGAIAPQVIFHWIRPRHAFDMLDILEHAGFRLVNRTDAWRAGQNKAMQLGAFERQGIPHPWSLFTRGSWPQVSSLADWGRLHVLKPHNSGRGQMVFRIRDRTGARQAHQRVRTACGGSLIQTYIDTGRARFHYREDVIGGRSVTGGIAHAGRNTWVTNEARGGRFEFLPNLSRVPTDVQKLAERAAAIGADYSGVDVMQDRSGALYVLEANEWPLFENQTARTLARYMVDLARERRD